MPRLTGVERKDNRYFAHLDFKGKRYTPGGTGFKTAEEAAAWRVKRGIELQQGIGLVADITFEDFAAKYIREYTESGVESTTLHMARFAIRAALLPALGRLKVRAITPDHITRLKSDLLQRYASSSVAFFAGVLKRILAQAIRYDIIAKNPMIGIGSIRSRKKEPKTLTPAQLNLLLSASPPMARTIYALAGLAGLRRSEVFGLQWGDIDFVANTLTVRRQYWRARIKDVKTDASRATLPMLDELAVILKEWKLRCGSQKWLFKGRGDKPLCSEWLCTNWKQMLAQCGLPYIRFHDLRHTFVTIMLDKGIPIIDVKYLARHTAIATTQQYAHKTPGHLEKVVKEIRVFEDGLHRMEHRINGGRNA